MKYLSERASEHLSLAHRGSLKSGRISCCPCAAAAHTTLDPTEVYKVLLAAEGSHWMTDLIHNSNHSQILIQISNLSVHITLCNP